MTTNNSDIKLTPLDNPYVKCVPIKSCTIPPFTHTNLLIIDDNSDSNSIPLIVDPGAETAAFEHLRQALRQHVRSNVTPNIFLTHHHHDHVDGIQVVKELFPNATVWAHKKVFERLRDLQMSTRTLEHNQQIAISNRLNVTALYTPGHTDGHMCLHLAESHLVVAGDHVVGFGTVTLDPDAGGDMREYFQSCRLLIDLAPKVIIPAHGDPNYDPVGMLQMYLKHRQAREDAILAAYRGGARDADSIVRVVYKDVSSDMWPVAIRNIQLHLRKLQQESKL